MVRQARVYLSYSASPIQQRVPAGSRVSLLMSSSSMSGFLTQTSCSGDGEKPLPSWNRSDFPTAFPSLLSSCRKSTWHPLPNPDIRGDEQDLFLLALCCCVCEPLGSPKVHDVVITLTIFMMARMYCSMSRRPWYPTIILSATTRVST